MKKSKGFTLIELLAVIVILAVIALIATPIIMNVINDSKKGAFKDTAYSIVKSAELYAAQELVKGNDFSGKNFSFKSDVSELEIKGSIPTSGTVSINKAGEVGFLAPDDSSKYCAYKSFSSDEVIISDYTNSKCDDYTAKPINGLVKDLSNSKNDGVMHGVTIQNNEAVFDGKAYITSGYTNYNFKNKITIAIRFYYPIDNPYSYALIGNWENAGGGIAYNTSKDAIYTELSIDGKYQSLDVQGIQKGMYHSIVLTYDGTVMSSYANGILNSTKSITGNISSSKVPIEIGANPTDDKTVLWDYARTRISDVIVLNRPVSASEVQENFKDKFKVINDNSVLFQYKF